MGEEQHAEDWYRGWRRWVPRKEGSSVIVLNPLLAETIGAGVVAADSADWDSCEWYGGGNHWYWDVRADNVRVDVKSAWHHADGVLGIPSPPNAKHEDPAKRNQYEPEKVDEILLVVLGTAHTEHEYLPDGTVTLTARAKAEQVYRVPVKTMNKITRQDRKSQQRWLVNIADIEPLRVRGEPPA
jgi:hypothetical protein